MSEEVPLPRAAHTFVAFVALLRGNGFAVAPEQTTAFLAAIGLLGPRSLDDVRKAGLATLAPPPERRATYELLFAIHFLGGEELPGPGAEDDEVVRLQDEGRGEDEPPLADEANESGLTAARAEALVQRRFAQDAPSEALRRLSREAPKRIVAVAVDDATARAQHCDGTSQPLCAAAFGGIGRRLWRSCRT